VTIIKVYFCSDEHVVIVICYSWSYINCTAHRKFVKCVADSVIAIVPYTCTIGDKKLHHVACAFVPMFVGTCYLHLQADGIGSGGCRTSLP
jgi:hypothetical protein